MRAVVIVMLLALLTGAASPVGLHAAPPKDHEAAGVDTTGSDEALTQKKLAIKKEMARIATSEVPGTHKWEREKSATVAMVSSMVLPGLGQLYNGRRIKTAIAVGAFSFYMGTAWLEQKQSQEHLKTRDALPPNTVDWMNENILYEFHRDNAVTYLWWSGAVWLISVLDAFVDAHLYDVRAVTPAVTRGPGGTGYVALSVGF
jgi:Family of unknown function (DUF5683)